MPLPSSKIYYGSSLIYDANVLRYPIRAETTTSLTTITNAGTTHTKSSWVELIASTDADAYWLNVQLSSPTGNSGNTGSLCDIGTGAAGSEVVRIANIGSGYRPDQATLFPIYIPSGTRIAARSQVSNVSYAVSVGVQILSDESTPSVGQTLDTYGASTAASRGTNMPTSNTYVEITSSTTQAYKALVATPTGSGTAFNNETSSYTIAKGASGSEVELFSFNVSTNSSEIMRVERNELSTIYVGDIPAGTRLAAKQSIGRNYRDIIIHGVPA